METVYIYNQNCVRQGELSLIENDDTLTYTSNDIVYLKKRYISFKDIHIKNSNDLFEIKKIKNALLGLGIEFKNIRNWFNKKK